MAVGEFLDYAPGPQPGSFQFTRANGAPLLAAGPQAAQLAQALQRQKEQGPQPVAQAGGFGGQINNGWATDSPAPTPAVQVVAPRAAPAPAPAPAPSAATAPGAPPPMIARPPESPAPMKPQWVPVARTGTGTIVRDANTGQLMEMTAGSPGVSRQQLQKQAGQGVALPSGGSEAVTGGFDRNPDYEERLANASIDQRLANQAQTDAAMVAADQAAQAHSMQIAAEQRIARQDQLREAEITQKVARDQQKLDALMADVKSTKIEPKRMFSGTGGALAAIGSAIAAGLGAYGAALARTPNYALDIINRAVDQDIAAQEADLATKKESANNALRQFMSTGATLDQARAATRASQLAVAQSQIAHIAAVNKSPQLAAAAQELDSGIQKQLAEQLERYRIESLGKHTAEVTSRYAYPQAGSAGGMRPVSLDTAQKLGGIQKTEAETAKTTADAVKATAEAKNGPPVPEAGKKVAATVAVLDEMGQRTGQHQPGEAAFSPDRQNVVTRGLRGATNFVAGEGTWLPGSEQDRSNQQEFDQIRNDLIAQQSVLNGQGALAGAEADRALKAIESARTWGELEQARQYLRSKANAAASVYGVATPGAPPPPPSLKPRGGK